MAEEQPTAVKSNRKIILIALIVAIVCLGGSAFVYFHFLAKPSSQVSPKDMKSVKITSMTVNLADIGGNRYVRTTITLEYSSDKLTEELNSSMYKVKDAIIKVLRETHANTFEDPQQVEDLKQKMLDEINSRLQTGKITGLYFEELLVQ